MSLLVLNASSMTLGTFESMSILEIKQMIDINIYQIGMILRLLLNKFYKRANHGKKSAIITVSSIVGTQPYPGAVIFSATKAFILFLTMAIGYEVKFRSFSNQTNLIFKNQIDI